MDGSISGRAPPSQSLPGNIPDDGTRPSWWSDGRDIVLWLEAIRRYDSSGWIREATGVTGGFARVWGTDLSHRFAIPSSGESLLAFDGISWNPVPVSSGESAGRLVYQTGATFQDGATVVLGDECLDDESCRPFLLQQDTVGRPWRRVSIPEAVGVPQRFTADTGNVCDPSQFAFAEVFGRSGEDYVVTGYWSTCEPGLEKLGRASGCPAGQPCTWRMRRGRLEPVEDFLGEIVLAVGYMDTSAFALLDDGTLLAAYRGSLATVTQVGTCLPGWWEPAHAWSCESKVETSDTSRARATPNPGLPEFRWTAFRNPSAGAFLRGT